MNKPTVTSGNPEWTWGSSGDDIVPVMNKADVALRILLDAIDEIEALHETKDAELFWAILSRARRRALHPPPSLVSDQTA